MIIDFGVLVLLAFVLLYGLVGLYLNKKRGKSRIYLIFYGFFCVYLTCLLNSTIFPLAYLGHTFPSNLWQSINFIPGVGLFKWESLMNLFLLFPLGFAIPFIWKIPSAKAMIPAVLVPGFVIELIQFLSGLISSGYTWRLIDINDYISYSLGIALGYLVFRLVASLFLELFPDDGEGVLKYIRDIFDRSVPKTPTESFSDEGY